MFYHFKKWWVVGLMAVGMLGCPVLVKAAAYAPTEYGGNFGLGLEIGNPGDWGISGKVWIDRRNAFQGAVKLPTGDTILQLDYLWHDFDLIQIKSDSGEWPFYIGVGGDLTLQHTVALAGRLPIGMSYIFNKKNVPVDIYLQLVPTLWFYDRGATLDIYGELGAHYYF